MYIFIIILIFLASLLVVLAVLAQNPKSGMAANFGASNAVMGVRQTADFLERFTWGLAITIVVLSLAATMAMPSVDIAKSKNELNLERAIEQNTPGNNQFTLPERTTEQPATEPTAEPAAEVPAQ